MSEAKTPRIRKYPIVKEGDVFGRLRVLKLLGSKRLKSGQTALFALCRCDCGRERDVKSCSLQNGATRSCGCLAKESFNKIWHLGIECGTKHGHAKAEKSSKEYTVWMNMKARCGNPSSISFHNYGARGISVCGRWMHFPYFLEDMGAAPSPLHSIERIDNDGNYEPSNCRWATKREQMRNRRNNRFIEAHGKRMIISDWAKELGWNSALIIKRMKRGWSGEEAVTIPLGNRRRKANLNQ